MWRCIVLGLLLAGCGGQTGIEGDWQTVEMATVVRAGDPLPTGASLRLADGRYVATGLSPGEEDGTYGLGGAAVDPFGQPGTAVRLYRGGDDVHDDHSLVWRGDTLWLRGEREGTFVVAFTRQ